MSTFVTSDRIGVQQAFPTIFDLRAAHTSLLKRHREGDRAPEMRDDIVKFVDTAKQAGPVEVALAGDPVERAESGSVILSGDRG